MARFTLYHTDGCHLCDQAYSLITQCVEPSNVKMQDIIDEQYLMEKYQTTIPVLEDSLSNKQLFWPFTLEQIKELLV